MGSRIKVILAMAFTLISAEKVTAATCFSDANACINYTQLCVFATEEKKHTSEVRWSAKAKFAPHVKLAKRRGLTCGVKAIVKISTVQKAFVNLGLDDRRKIQARLSSLNYYTSGIDGLYGFRTEAALRAYNKQYLNNAALTLKTSVDALFADILKPLTSEDKQVVKAPYQSNSDIPATSKKILKYKNRKALVIGNASYFEQIPLKNPINDAKAVAATLRQIGFEVTYKEDLELKEFGRSLGRFERELSSSDISLIYYAGHGIEVDGENYLIPVDAELRNASDVKFETVMLQDAVSASLSVSRLSMILIDACRDNPFAKSMKGKNRSIGRGLSVVDATKSKVDQIISFAAESGEFAEDGNGDNSPYAAALVDLLGEPNLEVGKLFRKLGDSVESMTKGKQIPVTRNRLSGEDIFFVVE